jgi:hypothetical protein
MLKRIVGILGMLAVSGCGSSSSSSSTAPSATAGTFQGTFAGSGGQIGTLTITTQAVAGTEPPVQHFAVLERTGTALSAVVFAAASTATGSIHLVGGSTISLSGTYDSSSGVLGLAGGGFTLNGSVISGGAVLGAYSSSGGSGTFSALSSTSSVVTTYCGTYRGALGLAMEISATGTLAGQSSDQSCLLDGQLSGNTVTFSCRSVPNSNQTATLQNGTISGISVTPGGQQIPWSASVCQ